ncbi:type II secretion system protein [Niallia sp. XMNu-256]|uniref:type IV pilus modification PilV family protein n=1 Tax=Niallia sp. XMNu-256 TaxID=3082444 RepID=UPI0030CF6ADF
MTNEKGITLVELLVAVVIAGLIIVPLLTIMTGTFTRTIRQEKETEIAYVAQEMMEKVRQNNISALQKSGCWTNISTVNECGVLSEIGLSITKDVYVEAVVKPSPYYSDYNEVEIIVKMPSAGVKSGSEGVWEKDEFISLVTVVLKP